MQPSPVPPRCHVIDVEAALVRVRLAEFRRDQHVLARLVPEVVVEWRSLAPVLPASLHLEGSRVEDREAARARSIAIAEHAHDDVVARHAVDGVGTRVARPLGELLSVDHLRDPGPSGIIGDVDDIDPRRAEPGNDQVRAVGPATGRAAAVPAEVVELVADVRHRGLVDDLAVEAGFGIGVDHRNEVRSLDAGAPVQAGEVEELLRRGSLRLGRRCVK